VVQVLGGGARVIGILVLGMALSADATAQTAAATAAHELAAGIERSLGKKPKLVLLADLHRPAELNVDFGTPLLVALRQQGVPMVDPKSIKAALSEAAASGDDTAFSEMAAAFGAQVLVTGRVDKSGDLALANVRAVEVRTGKLLASASASFSIKGGEQTLEARSLQAELRRVSDLLATGLDALPGEARYQRFAVMNFDEVGQSAIDRQIGTLVAAELTTNLHRDHGLMIVERSQLAKILEEMSLGQSGLTDPAQSVEVGKLAGAQALIVGTVSEAGDRYLVNARIVSVADAQVAFAAQGQLPAADLVALSSEAVVLRTRGGAVYRSILMPGWGQLYNRQGEKGAIFAGAEVLTAGLAVYFHLQGESDVKKYQDLDAKASPDDFASARDSAERNRSRRNLAIWAVVGIHALNILDALWNGKSFDSAVPSATGAMGAAPSF
jgi:TolB-like protein